MAKLIQTESQIQSAFITWTRYAEARYPALKLAFSVPNGAWTKNIALAMKLKREGMRPGVPDWILPVVQWSNRGAGYVTWHGLAIEFKRPGAKVNKQQFAYHDLLRDQGWLIEVCNDWQVARQRVEKYLSS